MKKEVGQIFSICIPLLFLNGCFLSNSDAPEQPIDERNNTHSLLQDDTGSLVSRRGNGSCPSSFGSETECSITQFKKGYRFTGIQYAQDWNYVPIDVATDQKADIDGDGVADRLAKYSGNLATFSAKHHPVAISTNDAVYFVFGGPVYLDNREHDNADEGPILVPSYKTIDPDRLGCADCRTPFTANLNNTGNLETPALGIYIARYDNAARSVSLPVLVHVKYTDDPHDNAVIGMDADQHIYVMISGRSNVRGALLFRSREPNSIDAFDNVTPISPKYADLHNALDHANDFSRYTGRKMQISYPKMFWMDADDGYFRLVFTDYCDDSASSGCGGRTLLTSKLILNGSEPAEYVDVQQISRYIGNYAIASAAGEDVVVAFNLHLNGNVDDRTNLYYLHSTDSGETWLDLQNRELELPLTSANALNDIAVVEYHSEGEQVRNRVYLKDISFHNSGVNKLPIILFTSIKDQLKGYQPRLNADIRLFSATAINEQWIFSEISQQVDHAYSTGMLHKANAHSYAIIFPRSEYENALAGGSLAKAELIVGESGPASILDLTPAAANPKNVENYFGTLCEFNYARPVHQSGAVANDIVGIVAAGNPFQYSNSNPIFLIAAANESNGLNPVWKLPESVPSNTTGNLSLSQVTACSEHFNTP